MKNGIIRTKFRERFRYFEKNSKLAAPLILGSYIVQILLCISIGYFVWDMPLYIKVPSLVLLTILIATRYRGINNIIHECCHLTFSQDKLQNFRLGSIAAAVLFASYKSYREEHLTHHTHLGDFEHDMDFMHRRVFRFDEKLSPAVIFRHICTPLLGLHLGHYYSMDFSARDGWPYQMIKIVMALAVAIALYLDPFATIFLFIIPFVWAFSAVNYWTDCADHGGLITQGNELEQSRNIILPRFIRYILFPRNDSFHLIHHLFPNVPSQHFDQCHQVLLEDASYRGTEVKRPGIIGNPVAVA